MAGERRALLDDEDDDAEAAEEAQLGYNEKYALRFAHNKKREDLHRLQELQKKGLDGGASDDDESSSEEEDDDGLLPARTDEKIFETLAKIKTRDPSIYSSETKFFGDDVYDEAEEEDAGGIKLKQQKPLYLKDVNARQLLEGGMEEDEEEEALRKPKKPPPSYLTEQDELKRAFLQGVREAEGEVEAADDLLRVKKKTKEDLDRDARDAEEAVEEAEQRAKDKGIAKRLEEYFGKDDDLDDDDKFLKEYLLNKGWIDEDHQKPRYPIDDDDDAENISEDEEALDKQDKFEKDYNFRFQEGVDNTYVRGHSRIIDDSVRKKPETRKKQRENKKERESEEERARREELKRLKNVKKKEVLEKLSKIRAVAGIKVASGGGVVEILGEDDLDEDFDPDEYDQKMKEAFGEEYYGAEDPDIVADDEDVGEIEKPDFDAEDELLGIASEEADSSAGFAAIKAKLDKLSAKPEKKKKKLKVPFEEKLLIDKHLEEYYKLDYEDVIGDLPTRFKYRPVKPNKYGLKTKDIIGLDDKELNQFVSLKKLAPYRTDEWEARRPVPRLSSKARRKKALNSEDTPKKKKAADSEIRVNTNEVLGNLPNGDKSSDEQHVENGDGAVKERGEGDGGAGSQKKKSRKRKKPGAPSPLPMSRLLSYAPPSTKKKVQGTGKMKKAKR